MIARSDATRWLLHLPSAHSCARISKSPSQVLDKILLASIEIGNQSGTLIGLKLYT